MIEKELTGGVLKIQLGTFREAKNLQDAILKELKNNKVDIKTELDANFVKDSLFGVISNQSVEKALWPLLERCVFDNERIKESLFDDKPDYRSSFYEICYLVALENIKPFMKDLFKKYEHILSEIIPSLSLK